MSQRLQTYAFVASVACVSVALMSVGPAADGAPISVALPIMKEASGILGECAAGRASLEQAWSIANPKSAECWAAIRTGETHVSEAFQLSLSAPWPLELASKRSAVEKQLTTICAKLVRLQDSSHHPKTSTIKSVVTDSVKRLKNVKKVLEPVAPVVVTYPPPEVPLDPSGFAWTDLQPSADSRMVYVSASEGNDANDGLSESTPKKTPSEGYALLRNGYPDWLLLKRGDTWTYAEYGSGVLLGEGFSGRSASEPIVVTSYGTSTERPKLIGGRFRTLDSQRADNFAVVGLHFERANSPIDMGFYLMGYGDGVLIEDCYVAKYYDNLHVTPNGGRLTNLKIRACVIVDAGAQGLLLGNSDAILIEGCVFDHNGWKDDDPSAPATPYNHNMYLHPSNSASITVANTITARASSHGMSHPGGIIEDNLYLQDPLGISTRRTVTVRRNVFLDGRDIGDNSRGFALWTDETTSAQIYDNVFAHQKTGTQAVAMQIGGPTSDMSIHDNVVYDWGLPPSGGIGSAALAFGGSYTGVNSVRDNYFQQPRNWLVQHGGSTVDPSVFQYSGNHYYSPGDTENWFLISGAPTNQAGWLALFGETNADFTQATFPHPERDIATYHASFGGGPSLAAFLDEARKQSHLNWRTEYTARAVNAYIREGFGVQTH